MLSFGIAEVSAISSEESAANDILNKNNTDSKVLVVYFSRTGDNYNVGNVEVGNTSMMASYIKEYLNADSFEIVPVEKYPDSYMMNVPRRHLRSKRTIQGQKSKTK